MILISTRHQCCCILVKCNCFSTYLLGGNSFSHNRAQCNNPQRNCADTRRSMHHGSHGRSSTWDETNKYCRRTQRAARGALVFPSKCLTIPQPGPQKRAVVPRRRFSIYPTLYFRSSEFSCWGEGAILATKHKGPGSQPASK